MELSVTMKQQVFSPESFINLFMAGSITWFCIMPTKGTPGFNIRWKPYIFEQNEEKSPGMVFIPEENVRQPLYVFFNKLPMIFSIISIFVTY